MSRASILNGMKRKAHQIEVALQRETEEIFDIASNLLKGTIRYRLDLVDLGGGRMTSRPKIISVSGFGTPKLFEKILETGLAVDTIRVLNSKKEDLTPEDSQIISQMKKNDFLDHLLRNEISYDEMIEAISAVHNLNGAILSMVA